MKKIIFIVLIFLLIYIGSYLILSRSTLKLMKEKGREGFYYVPCSLDKIVENNYLKKTHIALRFFYYPIWAIDYYFFNGPDVANLPMKGLE